MGVVDDVAQAWPGAACLPAGRPGQHTARRQASFSSPALLLLLAAGRARGKRM